MRSDNLPASHDVQISDDKIVCAAAASTSQQACNTTDYSSLIERHLLDNTKTSFFHKNFFCLIDSCDQRSQDGGGQGLGICYTSSTYQT